MAGFQVHLTGAALAAGVAATALLGAGVVTPAESLLLLVLGTGGGLLPDLDADRSTPLDVAVTLLSMGLAFLAMFHVRDSLTTAALLGVWLGVWMLCKTVVFRAFIAWTEHRGAFHSLPAALACGLGVAGAAYHLTSWPAGLCWLAGLFLALGFVLHLVLDEVWSLNLLGLGGSKQSLGTACKLWSASTVGNALVAAALAVTLALAPPWTALADLYSGDLMTVLATRLW
ncbi:MAG: metal-dependent hydrolase [Magnetococcus sp. WYHC-3]